MTAPPFIDVPLVERLVASQFPQFPQFPQWAAPPIRPVQEQGLDNRMFRLGDALSVRLPSATGYDDRAEKEQHWLPVLEPGLPLPILEPVALGEPGEGYPFTWSLRRWMPGSPATRRATR